MNSSKGALCSSKEPYILSIKKISKKALNPTKRKLYSFQKALYSSKKPFILYSKHCNTLQHTATHCNTLQLTATHCRTAKHCNTLQHTATHQNPLQLTATLQKQLQLLHVPPPSTHDLAAYLKAHAHRSGKTAVGARGEDASVLLS